MTENTPTQKRDYQKELREWVAEYLGRYPYDHGTRDFPSADELYEELVRPVALESFKNGKAAGMQAARGASRGTEPVRPSGAPKRVAR